MNSKKLLRLKKLALDNHLRAISYYSEVEEMLDEKHRKDDLYTEFKNKLMMSKFAHSTLDAYHDHLKKIY
jgi:hypothetical protein|tara:strand:- start:1261 stop:1470 length:210 start_codon:yes stop_codon:yes gene_type:complete